jgi:hypothetical protein
MIEEVEEIVKAKKWEYMVFERSFPAGDFTQAYDEHVYGICFTPPDCEPVHLEFLSNGRLTSFIWLELWGEEVDEEYRDLMYIVPVKTQFAGAEIHMRVLKILKYISRKYLLDFELCDEGEYWETEDEDLLREHFRRYDLIIGSFKAAIDCNPRNEGESAEDYIVRIVGKMKGEGG